jgi:hypothetical protein
MRQRAAKCRADRMCTTLLKIGCDLVATAGTLRYFRILRTKKVPFRNQKRRKMVAKNAAHLPRIYMIEK